MPASLPSTQKIAVHEKRAKAITLQDTINNVLKHHREPRVGVQGNRQASKHDLAIARAGFGPLVDAQGAGGLGLTDETLPIIPGMISPTDIMLGIMTVLDYRLKPIPKGRKRSNEGEVKIT